MTFTAKKDTVYAIIIWSASIILLAILLFSYSLTLLVIFILISINSLWIWNSTSYIIESGELIIKSWLLRKRVKIISQPRGIADAKQFIESIISPVTFKGLEVTDNELIVDAGGMQNKAALIGRNKRRLLEMQKIIKNYFGKELRIA